MEGLIRAKQYKPDLILTDYVMPGLDGEQFLSRIRDDATLSGTPVIVMTSEHGKGEVARFVALGIKDYLVKPVTLKIVLQRVVKVIGEQYLVTETKKPEGDAG